MTSYNDQSVIDSRFERTLIRCPKCSNPIGEREGNRWWFLKYGNGDTGKIPFVIDQSAPSGNYKVSCWDASCDGSHIFAWVNEEIIADDKVVTKLETVDLTKA